MHADALPPAHRSRDEWGLPVLLALIVHVLVALVFIVAWVWSPARTTEAAAGEPAVEASLEISAAEASAARQALRASEKLPDLPEPLAEPVAPPEPVPEDTVPPPQPLPEPRPQDAPTPQQHNAQERVAQPDTVEQERVSALAISQEKARQEQEAKRRQEQIDLTERKRVEEAEQKLRLAKQQEEADRQKKLAAEQQKANDAKAETERQQKLAELRRKREQAEKEAALAEQKLRQVADARNRAQAAASSGASTAAPAAPGQGGASTDLSAKYAAAIQQAVLNQWVRPDSVPRGQRCRLTIRQLPGGEVVDVEFSSSCPYDDAGRRSVEAAVLRAQPLPYRGFESVFQRTLNFNFEAQDR
ncbi:cell envelope integrity protein TolA [Stenotrophomonas sp. YIM B06876]|uniref:cell envelope integrity protein TolA n=1 Tax=Stenotrophomonas sp. YIM B06876 TaxID=3060211 RepID=UPI002739A887|nr:cell envelope integrity protein TolA [Stenotrophomonas sp. YIM B06876]